MEYASFRKHTSQFSNRVGKEGMRMPSTRYFYDSYQQPIPSDQNSTEMDVVGSRLCMHTLNRASEIAYAW